MRALVLLLLCFPAAVISQALDPLPQRAVAQAASTPPIPPAPAFGWVLDQSAQTIPAVFGSASLTGIGLGSLPTQAPDGAGNIDGPALLGQNASNPLVQSYALQDPTQASLAAGTLFFYYADARIIGSRASLAGSFLCRRVGSGMRKSLENGD